MTTQLQEKDLLRLRQMKRDCKQWNLEAVEYRERMIEFNKLVIEYSEIIKRLKSEFPQFCKGIEEVDIQVKENYIRKQNLFFKVRQEQTEIEKAYGGIFRPSDTVPHGRTRIYETMYAVGGFLCILCIPLPLGLAILILTFIIHMLDLAITSIRLHIKRNELSAFNEEEVFLGAAFETKKSIINLNNRINDLPCATNYESEVEEDSQEHYNCGLWML